MTIPRIVVKVLDSIGLNGLAGFVASLSASVRSRELVRVNRELDAWVHRYGDEVAVFASWYSTPRDSVRSHHDVFFRDYTPKSGDLVLDVGAGTGTEVVEFSRLVGPSGLVIAIEANPIVFERLCATIRLNRLLNVLPLHLALSSDNGRISIDFDSTSDPEGVGGRISSARTPSGVPVLGITLSSLLDLLQIPVVDFVKMNIEGAEGPVLDGSVSALSRVRNWCVSCHDFLQDDQMRTYDVVVDALRRAGFSPRSYDDAPLTDSSRYYVYAARTTTK